MVSDDVEPAEDRLEAVVDEESYTVQEPAEIVPARGCERFNTYIRLYQSALQGLKGYVAKAGEKLFLTAIPGGEPVIEVAFVGDEPPANAYIKVVRGSVGLLPGRKGQVKRVLMEYEWAIDDLADLKPPMEFRELRDRVSEGVEFASVVFDELYAYHLISAPFIVSPGGMHYIGGSRLALYGDHSESVTRGVLSLKHFMHEAVKYTRTLYSNVKTRRRTSILEVIASRNYRELKRRIRKPVESVGLVRKAPLDYAVDPEVAEAIFYYKVVKPTMFLNDVEVITLEARLLSRSRRLDDLRHSVILAFNTDLDSVLRAVLRLSTAIARARGSSIVEESDVKKAHERFFSAVEELASELGTMVKISTAILLRDVEWIIEKHGFDYRGFKCVEKNTILRTLVHEYSHTTSEAEKKIEQAKLAGIVFEPKQGTLCLLK